MEKCVHQISTFNAGRQLKVAVEASNNMQWTVQFRAALVPNGAHANDFKYYLCCWEAREKTVLPKAAPNIKNPHLQQKLNFTVYLNASSARDLY